MPITNYGTVKREGRTFVWSAPDDLPTAVRLWLAESVERLNALAGQGVVDSERVIIDSVPGPSEDVRKDKPCNANAAETHWWGVRVWLSDDIVKGVAAGGVTTGGVTALFGGPIGELVGVAVFAGSAVLAAASGRCGVRFDLTWVGVPSGYKRRT